VEEQSEERELLLGICAMRPMSDFDPSQRCWVHERLNKVAFAWDPERADSERLSRTDMHGPGVINWDGLFLDGWWPWDETPADAVEEWPWSS
jgi:hypothetical protein